MRMPTPVFRTEIPDHTMSLVLGRPKDLNGQDTFAEHRVGWPAPIHDLLARRGGVVVFHGHDHLYVHGERDGVVYQEVPQPGHPHPSTRSAGDYGY